MRNLVVFLFILLNFSCVSQKQNFPKEHFRLVQGIDLESAEDEELEAVWGKSSSFLLIDEEKGGFSGELMGESFSGAYEFGKVSSGFSKGISIRVDLGFFQSGAFESAITKAQKDQLVQTSSLNFYNDQMLNPKWNFLELKSGNGKKLTFLRKKEIGVEE